MKPFLLLQARQPDDPMRAHEHGCFAAAMQIEADAIGAVDVVARAPKAADLQGVKALLIGGSGNFSARGDEPWLHAAMAFLREHVIEPGRPMFAVCFGLQLLGRTLNVDVINDPDHREVGTFELTRTDEAANCPLFGDLPPTFWAQQGHNDRVVALPPGTTRLAFNSNAPVQAMRVDGKPIWATQFHPELTREDNATRYRRYISAYGGGYENDEDDPILNSMRETPHPTALLHRFSQMVLQGQV